ncbi:hypothetical protein [Rhizobium sp. 32-5/1]|uniref:hypothetical protein n=1 Tax=Rhizobium sp. 32-5/1 TaxID=3019602 RepID=UPI0032B87E72
MPPRVPLMLLFATMLISAADLPDRGPVPIEKPETKKSEQAPAEDKKPVETQAEAPVEKTVPAADAKKRKTRASPKTRMLKRPATRRWLRKNPRLS